MLCELMFTLLHIDDTARNGGSQMTINLQKVRDEKGVSRYKLAKDTGITYKSLWKIENGGDAKISNLVVIANVLKCSVKDFFD